MLGAIQSRAFRLSTVPFAVVVSSHRKEKRKISDVFFRVGRYSRSVLCFFFCQVAGGNSIFNVIVDTDDTAAKLMHLLERRKLGRVTFMPLNRLRGREERRFQIPMDEEVQVAHLIEVRERPKLSSSVCKSE